MQVSGNLSWVWELCLKSGDLFLDLPGDLDHLEGELGFAVDLLFLGNFSDKSSRVCFRWTCVLSTGLWWFGRLMPQTFFFLSNVVTWLKSLDCLVWLVLYAIPYRATKCDVIMLIQGPATLLLAP